MPKDSTVRSPPQTWTSACLSPLFAPESQPVASNDSIVGLAPAIGGFKVAESQTLSPDSCRHQGHPLRPTFGEGYSGVPWGLIQASEWLLSGKLAKRTNRIKVAMAG